MHSLRSTCIPGQSQEGTSPQSVAHCTTIRILSVQYGARLSIARTGALSLPQSLKTPSRHVLRNNHSTHMHQLEVHTTNTTYPTYMENLTPSRFETAVTVTRCYHNSLSPKPSPKPDSLSHTSHSASQEQNLNFENCLNSLETTPR